MAESDTSRVGRILMNLRRRWPLCRFEMMREAPAQYGKHPGFLRIRRFMLDVFPAGIAGIKVLDIGANGGFYTFSLAKEGAGVTAFEPHPRYGPAGKVIAREKRLPVEWIQSAFNAAMMRGRRFDFALMLSVFQRMAEGGKRLDEAGRDLRAVSAMST